MNFRLDIDVEVVALGPEIPSRSFSLVQSASNIQAKLLCKDTAPLLPTAHLQLLKATLEKFSSGRSESCASFGRSLECGCLTAHRVEEKDDWHTFYTRWRTGRMFEHLFLSRMREQRTEMNPPINACPSFLLELVRKYPYTKGLSSPTTDLPLLPRPPFSFTTRSHDAFFVRIEIELPYGWLKPSSKLHPSDTFSTKVEEGESADLWAKITTAFRIKGEDSSYLSNIFTDDTFLSLVNKPIA
ncbi:hypothetical protein BYT27DRAFT_7256676 [Phlegmacium glaucopus]|nr:hypothetical protein BYT27DRAFT_7256676 [Phlegmacium glaucopus]